MPLYVLGSRDAFTAMLSIYDIAFLETVWLLKPDIAFLRKKLTTLAIFTKILLKYIDMALTHFMPLISFDTP